MRKIKFIYEGGVGRERERENLSEGGVYLHQIGR